VDGNKRKCERGDKKNIFFGGDSLKIIRIIAQGRRVSKLLS
jgi:hypothetical protein